MHVLVTLLGCASPGASPDGPVVDLGEAHARALPVEALGAAALYRRASLDLRGRLPTLEELDALEGDPASLEAMLDALTEDPAFEERLVDLFAERWNMRIDTIPVSYDDFGLDAEEEYAYLRAVVEEPVRVMARVAVSDLPWTDVVTADWTLANETLADIWPLDREPGDGWQVARYTDGRPPNGVLATNGMWWRYGTTPYNYNRARAGAVLRLLVCDDLLLRPIRFDGAGLVDDEGLEEATRAQPTCVSCHSTLDPVASALFGFWNNDLFQLEEQIPYHPDRELLGEVYLGVEPAWYGVPLTSAADLGLAIAADDRFPTCTVRTVAEALWRRDADPVSDFGVLQDLRTVFLDDDLRLRALVRAVLDTDDYRAGALADDATTDDEERIQTLRVVPLPAVVDAVEDATGFRWERAGWDRLDNDLYGFRTLGGDVDGDVVTRPSFDPTASRVLVQGRLADGAARYVVSTDFTRPASERLLLDRVEPGDAPGAPSFDEQLVALHRRLYAAAPDAARIEADEALYAAVLAATGDPMTAWSALLSGMLRDPLFWTY